MGPIIMHRLHAVFLLLGVYMLSACSGNISAKVFLDTNRDNRQSGSEPLLASMPATLYRDGAQVEKLMTDAEGNVSFSIWQKGKYCVRLDESEVSQRSQVLPKALSVSKALGASDPESTPEATPDSSPKPDPTPAGQGQTSSQPVTTTKAYEACAETNGPLYLSVDVPVPVDFGKTIDSIAEPQVYSVSAGDEIEIPIVWPKQCRLREMTLPAAVGVPGAGDLIRTIRWSEVIALGAKPIVDQAPVAINRDTLRQFPLKLKVTDKILDLDPPRIEITPQVSCPGGLDYDLKTHVLETGGLSMFELYHDREGEAVVGGEVTILTHVVNHSNVDFPASDVRVTFTGPLFGESIFDEECGGSSHCSVALQGQQQKILRTKIKIPDALTQTTTFEFSATLKVKVDGYEREFNQEAPASFGVLPGS